MDHSTAAAYQRQIDALQAVIGKHDAAMAHSKAEIARLQAKLDRLHSAPPQHEQHGNARAVQRKGNRVGPPAFSESARSSSTIPPPEGG